MMMYTAKSRYHDGQDSKLPMVEEFPSVRKSMIPKFLEGRQPAMPGSETGTTVKLSVVVPCYNESRTLKKCIERVLAIADESLSL